MALLSYQWLRHIRHCPPLFNNFRLLRSTSNANINNISIRKEYKTEDQVIYYEDPDNFGTLSRQVNTFKRPRDADDLKEEKYLENKPLQSKKLTTKQYADLIKQYLKIKNLKQAIDVLEIRMLKEDRVQPENYIYNILIGACADVGYTKKAFKLYNDMKRRALKASGDTYTCLFNACANSPWTSDGLKHAKHLRAFMQDKAIEPNVTNYNAMIKAFGRCGDLSTAFELVDEMTKKKIKIRVHTFNFLLQACISEKNIGLRHALVVWRKMLKMREKPNIYSFNLMLKCVKDCNFGSRQDIIDLLNIISQSEPSNLGLNEKILNKSLPMLPDPLNVNEANTKQHLEVIKNIKDTPEVNTLPNLLSMKPQLHQVLALKEVSSPHEKFAIIGGYDEFLNELDRNSVKPDIKTFTQMLPLIENSTEAENKLILQMKDHNIKTDIEFYNMLIKKRCIRKDYNAAFAVKDIITLENKTRKKKHPLKKIVKCNIMTYGVLAMACETKEDGEKLIQDMKEAFLKINIEILGTLLRQGTIRCDFGYILYIMNTVKVDKIRVNDIFLNHLESFNNKCENIIKGGESGRQKCSELFKKTHNIYLKAYKKWLKEVNAEESLKEEHPWKQFEEVQPQPFQRQFHIKEPKVFYKKPRKFVKPYVVK